MELKDIFSYDESDVDVRYDLSRIGRVTPEEFKQLSSEIEILAKKEIVHDERRLALLEDPRVRVRIIEAEEQNRFGRPTVFRYYVRDHGLDERHRMFPVGEIRYNAEDLIALKEEASMR